MSIAGSVDVIAATIRKSVGLLVHGDADLPHLVGQARLGERDAVLTSTCAVSMSVPGWKVTVIAVSPWLEFERI
jgi:hypothetical protein